MRNIMRKTMRKTKGFTLIEMMMALTITGLLLTALAASISGSMSNLKVNEGSYKTINNARLALGRMCSQLRTSRGVVVAEASNTCQFVTSDGKDIKYEFDSTDKVLNLVTDDAAGVESEYLLCDGVEAMTFTKGLDRVDPTKVRNVQMSMTVKYGDITKKISTATVIMINAP
jgi:prepilin-type N-terminal cleavage/methylation domain-containing protein